MEILTFGVFAALGLLTAYYAVLAFRGKRSDVSWFRFVLAGPLVALHPERYVSKQVAERVPRLILLWLLLFVVLAICGAALSARSNTAGSP